MGYHPYLANDSSGIPGPLVGGIETKFAHGANNLHTLFLVLHFNFEKAHAQIDKQIGGKSVWLMVGHLGGGHWLRGTEDGVTPPPLAPPPRPRPRLLVQCSADTHPLTGSRGPRGRGVGWDEKVVHRIYFCPPQKKPFES